MRVLRLGATGTEVIQLQKSLAALGYKLRGTGYFGGATDTAVEDFQRRHKLIVDGIVGDKTWKALSFAKPFVTEQGIPVMGHEELPVDRPLWLIEGLRWINTTEVAGNKDNPTILEWAKAEGGNIAKTYTHDSIPWCALFANMILTKVGIKGTETLWALDFAKWGLALPELTVGAFVPMERPGGGHVAVVVGRDQYNNIMCLGGNQSDKVSIKPFPRTRLNRGFRWPSGPSLPTSFDLPLVRSDGKLSTAEA